MTAEVSPTASAADPAWSASAAEPSFSLIDREKVCPACHRLLPTGGPSSGASAAANLLPPFEHRAAISARRGSAGGAASKAEWQRLRARLDESHARQSHLHVHEEAREESDGQRDRQLPNDQTPKGAEQQPDKEMSSAELKEALARVLTDVEALSSRHEALLANQLDLENSLKIARSNLTLAEANSEMLEEALRRGGNGFAGRMAPPTRPATPALAENGVGPAGAATKSPPKTLIKPFTAPSDQPATPEHARPVLARRRSGSEGGALATSSPTPIKAGPRPVPLERSNTMSGTSAPAATATSPSAIGGFWRRSLDKRPQLQMNLSNIAADITNAIPSPSAEARSQFFANLGMTLDGASASTPNLGGGAIIERPRSPRPPADASSASATGAAQLELYRLRQTLQQTQSKLATLSEELTATKKAKTTVEEELETLSQELFEEANKMVSDERKLRATVEAEAAELKEERDALKRTIQLMEGERVEERRSAEAARQEAELLPEEPMTRKAADEMNGDAKSSALATDEEVRAHTPVPTDNDLDALMKRMEADFGKL